MLRITLTTLALGLASTGMAQTAEPATPAEPAEPTTGMQPAQPAQPATPAAATTGAAAMPTGEALPRCSAEVRDRCLQDERFASDRYIPGRSRDNNAMHYRTSREATARSGRAPR